MNIGVISDTHSLIRPEALDALRGSELIIHAGDIGSIEVITALEKIAPVRAVRGNNDRDAWAKCFPETDVIEVENRFIYLLHDLHELDLDPKAAGFEVVITGHSHKPSISEKNGVLYLNPGSAGPRRFSLPISLAKLSLGGKVEAKIVELALPR